MSRSMHNRIAVRSPLSAISWHFWMMLSPCSSIVSASFDFLFRLPGGRPLAVSSKISQSFFGGARFAGWVVSRSIAMTLVVSEF
jgi:hypothetical protein